MLGDTADLHHHQCRNGNWFFAGMGIAGLVMWALSKTALALSPLWFVALGLVVGWFLNQRELNAVKQRIAEGRAASATSDTY